ncbi:MAG: hypothetical protein IKF83_04955 [Clostridia bacterium]|nr:hypothetical protein [Clostridia bacterium]
MKCINERKAPADYASLRLRGLHFLAILVLLKVMLFHPNSKIIAPSQKTAPNH